MQYLKQSTSSQPDPEPRTVLLVDGDESYAQSLRNAWTQLWLVDNLKVVANQREALDELQRAEQDESAPRVAAVVLDPEVTGEETGRFLRKIRDICGEHNEPVILWTEDNYKYQVLEGRAVDAVLHKPMVLRLIQLLDDSCRLRVRSFRPYQGGSIIE